MHFRNVMATTSFRLEKEKAIRRPKKNKTNNVFLSASSYVRDGSRHENSAHSLAVFQADDLGQERQSFLSIASIWLQASRYYAVILKKQHITEKFIVIVSYLFCIPSAISPHKKKIKNPFNRTFPDRLGIQGGR